jgi:hypothetical protein
VEEALHRSFGYVIAYILPGLVALGAIGMIRPEWALLAGVTDSSQITLSAWICLLLASLGAGLMVSAARWLLIDTLHHRTGLAAPPLDFGQLPQRLEAFLVAVEHHYRYYQFHANLFVSLLLVMAAHLTRPAVPWSWKVYTALGALELLLLITSRDCLRRYYSRLGQLLAPVKSGQHTASD